jgi:hypothetical protein
MAETVAKWGVALKHGGDVWVVLHEQGERGSIVADAPRRILPDLIDPKLADMAGAGGIEAIFQLRAVEDGWAVVATRKVEPAREAVMHDAIEDVHNVAGSSPKP